MARSLSNAKQLLSSYLIEYSVSVSINRRGYASASEGVAVASNMAKRSGSRSDVVKKAGHEEIIKQQATKKEASEKIFWAPDPITGYYRPQNIAGDTDVAALSEKVCNTVAQR